MKSFKKFLKTPLGTVIFLPLFLPFFFLAVIIQMVIDAFTHGAITEMIEATKEFWEIWTANIKVLFKRS